MGEIVLTVIGGAFGLIAAGFVLTASGLFAVAHDSRASEIVWRGIGALLLSVPFMWPEQ